ncbi:MAG: TIGR02147 family protein, partial [Oligoflexia bacterium]|nr:TIGR02147 family protein [Oligoflexia bacterium]
MQNQIQSHTQEQNNDFDVFNFDSCREYLKQVLLSKKKLNPYLGIRNFTKKAGIKSPSTISMIINGKRNLTINMAEKIADILHLTGKRRLY